MMLLAVSVAGCTSIEPFAVQDDLPSDIRSYDFRSYLERAPAAVGSRAAVPTSIATIRADWSCQSITVNSPLPLLYAVEYALCNNAQTRAAWANVKPQLGLGDAAYLPTVTATLEADRGHIVDGPLGYSSLALRSHTSNDSASATLNWVLYDFGACRSQVDEARQSLITQMASQDKAILRAFRDTVQAYFDAAVAQATLQAKRQAETTAESSFKVADARFRGGLVSLSGRLCVKTALSQAKLGRIQAQGNAAAPADGLAATVELPADRNFTLMPFDQTLADTASTTTQLSRMMAAAEARHPSILAAHAKWLAAKAPVTAAKADGLPIVSLVGSSNDAPQVGQYQLPIPVLTDSDGIGLQLNIPLTSSIERAYETQSARAAADAAEAEAQISFAVWKNYCALQTFAADIPAVADLLRDATQSFQVAQGRYSKGVGSIDDLLAAQTTLASAREQRIQTLENWRSVRLRLMASLGTLDLEEIDQEHGHD